jgi:hypothetical protein
MIALLCLLVVLIIGWLVRGTGPKRAECSRPTHKVVAPKSEPKTRRSVTWAPVANHRTVDIESPVGETGVGGLGWIADVKIAV